MPPSLVFADSCLYLLCLFGDALDIAVSPAFLLALLFRQLCLFDSWLLCFCAASMPFFVGLCCLSWSFVFLALLLFIFFWGGDRFDIVVVCPCFVVFGLIVRYFYIPHVYLACFLKAVSLLCSALKTIFCFCFLQLVVLCVVCASLLCIFLLFCLFVCLFLIALLFGLFTLFALFSSLQARHEQASQERR